MNFKYESNRVYLEDDNGKVVAEVTFPNVSENVVKIDHTFVDDSLRGQGIAGQLMRATANHIKENDLKAIAECSYAISWFEKNKEEYGDLLTNA